MKIERTALQPKREVILKYFILSVLILFALKTIMLLFIAPALFKVNSIAWWADLALFSLGISIGVTLGSRPHQLIIKETSNVVRIKQRVLESLSKNGLIVKHNKEHLTTLEPATGFNRLFNFWFGTELVKVLQMDEQLLILGHSRYVEDLECKLRFGKVSD